MAVWSSESVFIPVFYSPTWDEYVGGFYVDRFPICQPNATSTNPFTDVSETSWPGDVAASARPAVSPWVRLTPMQAMRAIGNRSADERGWHLMTAWEYAVILEYCRVRNWFPRGCDHTTIEAASADDETERGLLDTYVKGRGWDNYRALPGTGPGSWTHNNDGSSGIYNLAGRCHKCLLGFFVDPSTGYARILANRNVRKAYSPYGRATSTGTSYITDTDKSWTTNEFAGCYVFTNEGGAEGTWYQVSSNNANTLTLSSGTPTRQDVDYVIVKAVSVDVRPTGSGNYIASLWTTGDYSFYLLPATRSSSPSSEYGGDGYATYTASGYNWWYLTRGDYWQHGTASGLYATSYNHYPVTQEHAVWYYACLAI